VQIYERAIAAVGRLDGVTTILPSTPLFLYMYVRKEALLSSQIEGTQSSLSPSRRPARRWKTSSRSASCVRPRDGSAAGFTLIRTTWPCSIAAPIHCRPEALDRTTHSMRTFG
jgi:hypothetical protein